jgi:preprotein translocase subunit YajC
MNQTSKLVVLIISLAVVGGAVWFFLIREKEPEPEYVPPVAGVHLPDLPKDLPPPPKDLAPPPKDFKLPEHMGPQDSSKLKPPPPPTSGPNQPKDVPSPPPPKDAKPGELPVKESAASRAQAWKVAALVLGLMVIGGVVWFFLIREQEERGR